MTPEQRIAITGGWAFGLGAAMCLLVFLAALAPAFAVGKGAAADCYRAPDMAEARAIKATGFYRGYANREEAVLRIFDHTSDGTRFYFVRMESDYCDGARCMTGIFKDTITGENLQSWGALPALTAIGKSGRRMCDGCDPIFPLAFYMNPGDKTPRETIYFWRHGVFFGS